VNRPATAVTGGRTATGTAAFCSRSPRAQRVSETLLPWTPPDAQRAPVADLELAQDALKAHQTRE